MEDLGGVPDTHQADKRLKWIRRAAREGFHPMIRDRVRCQPSELIEWTSRVGAALRKRNLAFHSVAMRQAHGSAWSPVSQHLRSRAITPLDAQLVDDLRGELNDLSEEGERLHHSLLRCPRPEIRLRNVGIAGQPWVIILHGDNPKISRPTEAEMDHWWKELGPWWSIDPTGASGQDA